MKILTTNSVIKKIILILLVVIMLNNFIMPNYVRADDEDSFATKLSKGFFGLLARLGDWVLQLMQYVMVGISNLTNLGEYEIMYSPGIIFSDRVASLKIDFIGQTEDTTTKTYKATNIKSEAQIEALLDECERDNRLIEDITFTRTQLLSIIENLFPAEGKNELLYKFVFIQVWNYRFDILYEFPDLISGADTGGDHWDGAKGLGRKYAEWLLGGLGFDDTQTYYSSDWVKEMREKYNDNETLIKSILNGTINYSDLPAEVKEKVKEEDIKIYNQVTSQPLQWTDFKPDSFSTIFGVTSGATGNLIEVVNNLFSARGRI